MGPVYRHVFPGLPFFMDRINDYLHLYLGHDVQVRKKNDSDRDYLVGRICEVTRKSNHGDWIRVWFDDCHKVTYNTFDEHTSNSHSFFMGEDEIRLVLRPLSEITDEEIRRLIHWDKIVNEYATVSFSRKIVNDKLVGIDINFSILTDEGEQVMDWALEFHLLNAYDWAILMSMGLDVFHLIERGLAIKKS
jgi:hypothetical protein